MIRPVFLSVMLIALLLSAGCSTFSHPGSGSTTGVPEPSPDLSSGQDRAVLAQPAESSRFIRMNTDIYTAGDLIEFEVMNQGTANLVSPNDNPGFSVIFQTGRGSWAKKMGNDQPAKSNASILKHGESSKKYQFVTDGWEAGRYRIVSDYGIEHEFLIRKNQTVVTAPACAPVSNSTPLVTIDPIPDHGAREVFSLSGTTNLDSGRELQYQVFAVGAGSTLIPLGEPVSLSIDKGSCNRNTWSVAVMMPEPGTYLVGITDKNRTVTAIRRFTIQPATTATPAPSPGNPVVTQTPSLPTTPGPRLPG